MTSQNDSDVFSVRIVSLDFYMSPPIPNLDSCYNSFLGSNVEEVPVIRIFGATPAGQKTCLHVHQALPYFYVPFPEDLLQSPDKGHTFIHTLFSATEKALSNKPTSKRQHVHDCSLVRAKKFYGYHSSEEVFVKVILYYPRDIPRAASLLLDGSILGKSFQPFEAHIPYLLQFLVDYNLYGMSHLHTSKVMFRSPLTYSYNAAALGQKNYDIPEISSSYTCKKPKIWDSCTVPSDLLWPDSTFSFDSTKNKYIHLTRRQSTCQLEADTSVEDIINEKFKIYTSFSQTRVGVRMVQSLVPIWEEEYERSGVQEAIKQDDPNKPHPDKVLRGFMHGLDYDKALSELCIESCKYFPSRIHVIDGDEKLAKYMKSFSDISTKVELLGVQQHSNICGVHLVGGIEDNRCKEIPSSQSLMKADMKSLDAEALGLLNWLASSQAEEELDAGDELVQETILTPLLPRKLYSVALEIAHRDYENASQLECQDILDSVEDILKPERSKEHASSSVQDLILDSVEGILKSEGSKDQASSSSRDFLDDVSSVIVIPQVDGSFDEKLDIQKGNTSESSMSYGGESTSAQPGLTDAKISYKPKENKLWGTLPFSISESKHEAFETFSPVSSGDEMMSNCFKKKIFLENCSEKHRKTIGLCSVRDLMRKKRCLRVEQAEAEVQKNEDMVPDLKDELIPTASVTHQNVQGDIVCSTILSSGFQRTKCLEHQSIVCEIFGVNNGSSVNEVSYSKNLMDQEARNVPMHETESKKLLEVSDAKPAKSVSHSFFSGVCRDERPVTPPSIMKCPGNNSHNSAESDSLIFHLQKDWNSGYVAKKFASNPDNGIAHVALLPEMHPRSLQEPISEENASEGVFEMTLVSRPPSNEHIRDPDVSLSSDGTEKIMPFFPGVSLGENLHEDNVISSRDLALGIPTHFQNDGSVLYMLTYALPPPTLNTVYDWFSLGKQHCVLDIGASKEVIDSYIDGVLNDGASCCQNSPPPTVIDWSLYDLSQWNEENCSSEAERVHPCVSSDTKLDSLPAKEKVITDDLCDLSQISGPDKYQNLIPTPLSQIGFRDPAYLGCGQQLTLISMELQAESRGDLRPDPNFDAINALSLVVQEDSSNISQIYVLLRVTDDELAEKHSYGMGNSRQFSWLSF
ncbi:hypothetical protein KSP40_PGU011904 [Platanthera guangdongensis]|uniref:DNA polymerase zeta catalytic subunit n=1 Tax=Platanthera guangdongensis TaxID=2320717 RepID=A0ABR2MA22_9ASPA